MRQILLVVILLNFCQSQILIISNNLKVKKDSFLGDESNAYWQGVKLGKSRQFCLGNWDTVYELYLFLFVFNLLVKTLNL